MGLFEEDCDVMRHIKRAIIDSSTDCENHFVEYDPKYADMSLTNFAPTVRVFDKRKTKVFPILFRLISKGRTIFILLIVVGVHRLPFCISLSICTIWCTSY